MSSGAILVGGRATRLGGRDKGALLVGGRAILERQLEALAQITQDIMLVGANSDRRSESARVVSDRIPNCGPLGGLDAALAAAQHDRLVLLACDMPFVSAAFLAHLLRLTENADAVVPRTGRGYHPLCAAYTRACQPVIVRHLAEGRLKMLDLLDEVRVHVVDSHEIDRFGDRDQLLANVNTPGDLHEFEALPGHEL